MAEIDVLYGLFIGNVIFPFKYYKTKEDRVYYIFIDMYSSLAEVQYLFRVEFFFLKGLLHIYLVLYFCTNYNFLV